MTADILRVPPGDTFEDKRIKEHNERVLDWKRWGRTNFLYARWDYSSNGEAWDYFTHDQSRKRAYRWGEDGLLGICDRNCRICFCLSMWNGKDPILKERLYGVTGKQGNHGEDVKELYYYLDSTPTHSYMKGLYKYPIVEYPYETIVHENLQRGQDVMEYEILDTGIFAENKYFDVVVEYGKETPREILIRVTVFNRSSEEADYHFAPNIWFRNTWTWGCDHEGCTSKPMLWKDKGGADILYFRHETIENVQFRALEPPNEWLFTDNETNVEELWGVPNDSPYTKDAFNRYIIGGETTAVNPNKRGTKTAPYYFRKIPPGESVTFRFKFIEGDPVSNDSDFDNIIQKRLEECDEFYNTVTPTSLNDQEKLVLRQAYAGLMWTKQFYHYVVRNWLEGDPVMPEPPQGRYRGRNVEWEHLFNRDVISMPDKWEYPWYAAWDLAFHMIPIATIDAHFAKFQLLLFLREWFMHPNGMIPAYEWDFSSLNPPVHAWACWNVYCIDGAYDKGFLLRAFQKLLINFTWWVNRKDAAGNHIFTGGFLGLDNISVFDRNEVQTKLAQADATSWMAFYCAYMLTIAIELAKDTPAMQDIASKFFEHFVAIIHAINTFGGSGLWDEKDGFFYDKLLEGDSYIPLRIRSVVGLIPLAAVVVLDMDQIDLLPDFKRRMEWVMKNKPWISRHILKDNGKYLLSVVNEEKLKSILRYVLDPEEFLSPFGIRSLSKFHRDNPFEINDLKVMYTPGESTNGMFGGNSNWRGPIWFPINFLIIEALRKYYTFFGDSLTFEFPMDKEENEYSTLIEIAEDLCVRCTSVFLPHDAQESIADEDCSIEPGMRPCHGFDTIYRDDPHFKDLVLFYEYFHGDTGRGLGASHQTGWTGLCAYQLQEIGRYVKDFPLKERMKSSINKKPKKKYESSEQINFTAEGHHVISPVDEIQ